MAHSGYTHSLNGNLLLAAPLMRDPNFSRSVLYLASHSRKTGAFGYILNRPLNYTVADFLPKKKLGPVKDVPVYMGGPVGVDKLSFASMYWSRKRKSMTCRTHLSVDDTMQEVEIGHQVLCFVGYAGWSKGQLERELEAKSWIVAQPDKGMLDQSEPEKLWADILTEMGPKYELLAGMPEQPEFN